MHLATCLGFDQFDEKFELIEGLILRSERNGPDVACIVTSHHEDVLMSANGGSVHLSHQVSVDAFNRVSCLRARFGNFELFPFSLSSCTARTGTLRLRGISKSDSGQRR